MIYLDSSIYSQLTSLQGLLLYRKIRTLELSSPLDNFAYLSLRLYSLNLLQHTLPARVKIPRIARHHDELVRVQRGVIFRSRHDDGRETKSVAGLCRYSCRTRILVRGHIDNLSYLSRYNTRLIQVFSRIVLVCRIITGTPGSTRYYTTCLVAAAAAAAASRAGPFATCPRRHRP
jgi:hypothetical protein